LNRYSYVLNSPLRYTDPTGHAHYNPGDGSDSTKPKVCYSYTYPQTDAQSTPTSPPVATPTPAFAQTPSPKSVPTPSPTPLSVPNPTILSLDFLDPEYWADCQWRNRLHLKKENVDWIGVAGDAYSILSDVGVIVVPEEGAPFWVVSELIELGFVIKDVADVYQNVKQGEWGNVPYGLFSLAVDSGQLALPGLGTAAAGFDIGIELVSNLEMRRVCYIPVSQETE
ncbi:MAG: hypothetical protein WHX52_23225, partial [Anaerolineae bacterium]